MFLFQLMICAQSTKTLYLKFTKEEKMKKSWKNEKL